jgi:branched-chain amino acid transport system substrate-binding protein
MALLIVSLAALVAGCGGSDSTSSSTPEETTGGSEATGGDVTTVAAKGSPVKIALLVDNTGPNNGGQGQSIPVIEAWAEAANEAEGVGGHPVSIEVFDSKGNPSIAAGNVQKVAADKAIVGVVSVDASDETNTLKALSKAGVPVIGGTSSDPSVWGATTGNEYFESPALPGVFQTATAFPATIAAQVTAAQEAGAKNVVSIDFAQVPASASASELLGAMAGKAKLTASSITVNAEAPNFTAQCLQIIEKNAEYVTFETPPDLAARVMKDCNTQGYEGVYGVQGGNVTAEVFEAQGDNKIVGSWTAFPPYSEKPAAKHFREVMEAQGVDSSDWEGANGPVVWATMELFQKVVGGAGEEGKEITRDDVLKDYGTVSNETLDGMLPGPVTFTKGKVSPPACFFIFTSEGGEPSGSSEFTCPAKALGAG